MIQNMLAFTFGVILLQNQSELPPFYWNILLAPAGLVVWYARSIPLIRLSAILSAGFLWAALHAHHSLASELKPELEGQDLLATGFIASLPDVSPDRTRFEFAIDSLTHAGEQIDFSAPVLLTWYRNAPVISVGQKWQLLVRLKRPHGMLNPGGQDYERSLYIKDLRATGYIRSGDGNRLIASSNSGYLFDRLRQQIGSSVEAVIENKQVLGIINALVIGDRSQISSDQWLLFRQTGTNHLMAISGLHVGIVSGLFFFITTVFWKRFSRGCQWMPAQQVGAVAALLAATCYAGLAGFAIPCLRALIMLSVVMGSLLSRRSVNPVQSLSCALLLVVLLDPVSVLSMGFWLSFGAVIVILLGIQGRISSKRKVFWGLLRTQWIVSLGLAPILMLLALDVPLISPLVNIIMVPLFSLLLIPLLLGSVVWLFIWPAVGASLLKLSAWLIVHTQSFLSWIAEYSLSGSLSGEPPVWMLIGILLSVTLLLMPSGFPGRWMGLFMIFPLVFFKPPELAEGQVKMTMLDVGQGLAIVLETAQRVILYDTGPSYPSGFDTGELVVVPYLKSRGIKHIDRIIVSNGDSDHRGGLRAVLDHLSVGDLISGEPHRIPETGINQCRAGEIWSWDGVEFEILHPDNTRPWKGNNASCVLAVRNNRGQILLTGDIEAEAEASLISRHPDKLASLVISVPHHGSASSSGKALIRRVGAKYGLISSGYKNRYHFPKESVTSRWESANTRLYTTAKTGAISLILTEEGRLQGPWSHRQEAHRYWMSKTL